MAGLGGSLGYAMGGLDWGVLGTVKAEVDFYFSKKFFFQLRFLPYSYFEWMLCHAQMYLKAVSS